MYYIVNLHESIDKCVTLIMHNKLDWGIENILPGIYVLLYRSNTALGQ